MPRMRTSHQNLPTGTGPSKIMVIRHAEKPVPDRTEGVRWRGEPSPESLTPLGWQRAGALVHFFEHPYLPHIARPDHLFAVSFDRALVDSSRRSRQTLRPLSKRLGLTVQDRLGKEQEDRLVQSFAMLSGTVLIAWSHENIVKIARALGAAALVPSDWPDERFDVVWVFDRRAGQMTFTQVPQCLMAGDSTSPIAMNGED